MADESRDLLNSFATLVQNRLFMMVVLHQGDLASRRLPSEGRGQLSMLQVLLQTPNGLTNAELAQLLDIRPSSVSAMVSKLEDSGLVERTPSETDKRTVIIKLSQTGREHFNNQKDKVAEMAEKVFSGLSEDEQTELNRLLTKLTDSTANLDWQDFMGREQSWPFKRNFGHGRF